MSVQLNRLRLTGLLPPDAPQCVIDLQLRTISSTTVPRTNIPLNLCPAVARFVNPKATGWSEASLGTAFAHLLTFYDNPEPPLPPRDFVAGEKTPQTPLAYDASMLYVLCRMAGVKLSNATTLEAMAQAVRLLEEDPEGLRQRLIDAVRFIPLSGLIRLSAMTEFKADVPFVPQAPAPPVEVKTLEAASLGDVSSEFDDPMVVLRRLEPATDAEAVILGGRLYGFNLLEAPDPQAELREMKRLGSRYLPLDPTFRSRFLCNPRWYNIRETWEPRLNCLYSRAELAAFAQVEGTRDLELARVSPTFYLGVHPSLALKPDLRTVIGLENPFNLDRAKLVSYGCGESFEVYTFDELKAHFHQAMSFANPALPLEEFRPKAIRKLYNIVPDLRREIGMIFAHRASHPNLPPKYKAEIIAYLERLLELGWAMRGWTGQGPVPLEAKATENNHLRFGEISLNVTEKMSRLQRLLGDSPPDLRLSLEALPLMKYGQPPVASNDPEIGLTIEDRLAICRDGRSIHACIRTSSNHLLTSAFHYLGLLGQPAPFDYNRLEFIV